MKKIMTEYVLKCKRFGHIKVTHQSAYKAETSTGWARLTDEFGITSEKTLIQAGEAYDIETLTLEQ